MWSRHCIVVALIAGLAVAITGRAESVGERLHKGVYQEETVGDLEAAMKIYQEIVADEKANRPHAAQAKYRLGMCHVKKGEKEKAVAAFEGALAYLDTVGTRAGDAAYKRMRLILTSAQRKLHNEMHRRGRGHRHLRSEPS